MPMSDLPLAVRRYFWRRLLGLSGMVETDRAVGTGVVDDDNVRGTDADSDGFAFVVAGLGVDFPFGPLVTDESQNEVTDLKNFQWAPFHLSHPLW